jgi:Glycosyl hydrolases family 16
LIETKGSYSLDAAIQDGTKDEIDFFEYYGGSNEETMNVFRNGQQVADYPQTLYQVDRAGNELYTYELFLNNEQRNLSVTVYNGDGEEIEHRQLTGDSVPTQPMELFLGIWDCSGNGFCPGKVDHDTWMGVKSVYIDAC